jgi:hypothetical protein
MDLSIYCNLQAESKCLRCFPFRQHRKKGSLDAKTALEVKNIASSEFFFAYLLCLNVICIPTWIPDLSLLFLKCK